MTQLASSRSLLSTLHALAVLLLAGGASVTACGGGGGSSGDGDGDGDGSGGKSGMGGMGANAGDGDGDNGGTGGMGIIDPNASVGDIRLLECGEESEGLQAQLYAKTGWHNQTECERPFLSTWDTAQPGASTEKQLKLPLVEEGTYDFWIDWGDENLEHITDWDAANTTHTYSEAGEYDVRVVGEWVGFRFWELDPAHADFSLTETSPRDAEKLLEISQWGELSFGPVRGHFAHAKNFQLTAMDAPDLSETTSLFRSFSKAAAFNADIGHWDISTISSLEATFSEAATFNGDIGAWDTSNVTSMYVTFRDAALFNQDISSWDTSNVTSMEFMFYNATAFDQPIGTWDTSSLEALRGAFNGAISFNRDLNDWDVSGVGDFFAVFEGATSFNGSVDWDVSSATRTEKMFYNAVSFDQDIGDWDVSNVTNMTRMFSGADSFNQPIGAWDVSAVVQMTALVSGANAFNQDLSAWQVPNVTTMEAMFNNSGLSTTNYSKFLSSCAAQAGTMASIQSNVPLGALGIQYSETVESSRNALINVHGWIIEDGGVAP